jgi:methionyl-tRNA synthetase
MDVSLDDFKKIELKVAKILNVEDIPGADRLWRLQIDVGSEKKEIVAGIKKAYPSKEALVGKCIVVVNNLLPATIRGIESRGMLLAAKNGEDLTLLMPDRELAPGSAVG